MKGGHLAGDEAVDLLVTAQGVRRFAAPRLASPNLHGTGCTLSSAIAAISRSAPTLPKRSPRRRISSARRSRAAAT